MSTKAQRGLTKAYRHVLPTRFGKQVMLGVTGSLTSQECCLRRRGRCVDRDAQGRRGVRCSRLHRRSGAPGGLDAMRAHQEVNITRAPFAARCPASCITPATDVHGK